MEPCQARFVDLAQMLLPLTPFPLEGVLCFNVDLAQMLLPLTPFPPEEVLCFRVDLAQMLLPLTPFLPEGVLCFAWIFYHFVDHWILLRQSE